MNTHAKRICPTYLLWVITLFLVLPISSGIFAQDDTAQKYTVDIPAGPLDDALLALGNTLGINILAAENQLVGKTSTQISGTYSVQDAIDMLLSDTDLFATKTQNGDYIVSQRAPNVPDSNPQRQDDDSGRPLTEDVELIVVTGTKQNRSVQETYTSVSIITADDIRDRAIFNVQDILDRTPNVQGGDTANLNTISIRGVGLSGVGLTGGGQTSNIYVDNAPNSFNANRGTLNLWDVSQVEVLRGPQSTVQGRNALAGALIINTADPEYMFGAKGRAIAGNNDLKQYSGMLTGPIIEDQVAFRLSADTIENDFGVVNVPSNGRVFFEDSSTFRGKLLFEPEAIEGLRVELIAESLESESGNQVGVFAPVRFSDPSFNDFDPFGKESFAFFDWREDMESTKYVMDVKYAITEHWSVVGIGTYADADRLTDFSFGPRDSFSETYSAELRAIFEFDDLTGWIGAYYFDDETGDKFSINLAFSDFGFDVTPSNSTYTQTTESGSIVTNYALFADVTYDVAEDWQLELGVRYDQEDLGQGTISSSTTLSPENCVIAETNPTLGGQSCIVLVEFPNTATPEIDYSAFLPRAAITYALDKNQSVAITAARGYRRGGFSNQIQGDGSFVISEYDPEYLTSYEVVYRSEWPELGLTANANLFFSDWTDQQVSVPGPSGSTFDSIIINAGESELYGLEASITYRFSRSLNIYANIGLLNAEFTDFPFAVDGDGNPVNTDNPEFANLAGNNFDNAPSVTGSFGFVYENDTGIYVSMDASFASSSFSDVTNLPQNETDAYTLVNGRMGYRHDHWEISIFVDNLFDERYANLISYFSVNTGTGVAAEAGLQYADVNEPRQIGMELIAYF
ncbi:MAG: TonB-dependent receptor [Pseudomonadota bacterium]